MAKVQESLNSTRSIALAATVLVLPACTGNTVTQKTVPGHAVRTPAAAPRIEFLTRKGCSNTPVMKERVDAVLAKMELPITVVPLETLSGSDPRLGYGTPTLLVDGVDVFGAPEPKPPYAAPS